MTAAAGRKILPVRGLYPGSVKHMYRFQPLLFQPVETRTPFSFSEIVEQERAATFPQVEHRIEVRIVAEGPLASIRYHFMGRDRHVVVFHPVLNHPGTPEPVVRFIARHELTHLICPPRFMGGRWVSHPPEFWEHEYAVAPERYACWHWIYENLRNARRTTRLGFRVKGSWGSIEARQRTPYTPHLPLDSQRWERLCPDDGRLHGPQLLLPPDWAPGPLPATVATMWPQTRNRYSAG